MSQQMADLEEIAELKEQAMLLIEKVDKLSSITQKKATPNSDFEKTIFHAETSFETGAVAQRYWDVNDQRLGQLALKLWQQRADRARLFGDALFGEPAWDMLLDLYANQSSGRIVSVSSLGIASNGSATTSLRWIDVLIEAGLIKKFKSQLDARVSNISLTKVGADKVSQYLCKVASAGL